jgi:hypothetical protein
MAQGNPARILGDRYQHLYSWMELLRLLDDDSPFEHGFVEHPEAGAADDVTLHARAGSAMPSQFIQVKFHVDHRESYSIESLVRVERGVRSLLRKLFDSWMELRGSGPLEVWLVSNWAAAPDLGRFIGEDLTLSPGFFERGGAERWRGALDAGEEDLRAFCRDLRLRLGFGSFTELERQVDVHMRAYGLRPGDDARAQVIDQVVRWVTDRHGDRRITRARLLEVIRRRRLRAEDAVSPRVALVVHGWERVRFDVRPTVELDWSEHFVHGERIFPEPTFWESEILPNLEEVASRFARRRNGEGMFVDVRGKMPLSMGLAVGFALRQVKGFRVRVRQGDGPSGLWHSDAQPSEMRFVVRWRTGDPGEDVLVLLGVTSNGSGAAKAFFEAQGFSAAVYAEPTTGTGLHAVGSEGDAVALAECAKELIRSARREYGARRTHLVLFAPLGLAVFLGQILSSVGEVVSYERTSNDSYAPAVSIRTG